MRGQMNVGKRKGMKSIGRKTDKIWKLNLNQFITVIILPEMMPH
jgi:hypothetical protein